MAHFIEPLSQRAIPSDATSRAGAHILEDGEHIQFSALFFDSARGALISDAAAKEAAALALANDHNAWRGGSRPSVLASGNLTLSDLADREKLALDRSIECLNAWRNA